MGCDIHTYVETLSADGTWSLRGQELFTWRQYGVFGWLADVRNYSAVPPLAQPRGLPPDVSGDVAAEWEEWVPDGHTPSWFTAGELLAFDYDATFEDRRVVRGSDHGATAEPGGGTVTTYRDFLGPHWFSDLEYLRAVNWVEPARLVFWFDN